MASTNPTPTQAPAARRPSEPVSIGDALAELMPRLRAPAAPSSRGERDAFYTTPKGR